MRYDDNVSEKGIERERKTERYGEGGRGRDGERERGKEEEREIENWTIICTSSPH